MFSKLIDKIKNAVNKRLPHVLILFSILIAVTLARNVMRIKRVNQSIEEEERKVEELRSENEKLKAQLEILKSEEYQEKQVRDKLGLAKEGELIVVLPEDEVLWKFAPQIVEEEETLPDPNWKKWWKLFF